MQIHLLKLDNVWHVYLKVRARERMSQPELFAHSTKRNELQLIHPPHVIISGMVHRFTASFSVLLNTVIRINKH